MAQKSGAGSDLHPENRYEAIRGNPSTGLKEIATNKKLPQRTNHKSKVSPTSVNHIHRPFSRSTTVDSHAHPTSSKQHIHWHDDAYGQYLPCCSAVSNIQRLSLSNLCIGHEFAAQESLPSSRNPAFISSGIISL